MSLLTFRPGHRVQPLIEAEETYAAIERTIAGAESEVFMAYWSLAPDLGLVTDVASDWEALLRRAVARGVRFRILLADFDPVFTLQLHRSAWNTYLRIKDLPGPTGAPSSAVQVVCSRNPVLPGMAERMAAQVATQFWLRGIVDTLNGAVESGDEPSRIFAAVPGLWRHVRHEEGRFVARRFRSARPLPGSHHEKLCIVDRSTAFVGGLDIGERRYDTLQHDRETPWHDLACRIEGPAVDLLTRHFVDRWNLELKDFRRFLDHLPDVPEKPDLAPPDLEELEMGEESAPDGSEGGGEVAVATCRAGGLGASRLDGDERIADLPEAVRELIGSAERFIYVETQFLREPKVVDWLIEAARRAPDLQVLLLLPLAPDRLNPGGDWSSATRHGHWLQYRNVRRLQRSLGERFGIFTLTSRQKAGPDDDPEDVILDTRSVYVHAKTIIVDDSVAMVGSANLNGRSFWLDTETAFIWREPEAVAAYRKRLWRHHLGTAMAERFDPTAEPPLALWRRAAEANRRTDPDKRPGFAVPLPRARARLKARPSPFIRGRYV